jgi:prevent-host-death family protein
MPTVTIKDAKNRLTELARLVEAGETVVITRNGTPVADLVPHKRTPKKLNFDAVRQFNEARGIKGIVSYIAPDFDDPLPEDFLISPMPPPVKRKQPKVTVAKRKPK